ncbi:MAG TPA: hypothetical protein VIG85_09510, partial [Comamonas sp.]
AGYYIGTDEGISINHLGFDPIDNALTRISISYIVNNPLDANGERKKILIKMNEEQARKVEKILRNNPGYDRNAPSKVKAKLIASYKSDHSVGFLLLPYYIDFLTPDGEVLMTYAIDNKKIVFNENTEYGRSIPNIVDLMKQEASE